MQKFVEFCKNSSIFGTLNDPHGTRGPSKMILTRGIFGWGGSVQPFVGPSRMTVFDCVGYDSIA
jgi:hypothetical protein